MVSRYHSSRIILRADQSLSGAGIFDTYLYMPPSVRLQAMACYGIFRIVGVSEMMANTWRHAIKKS